MTIFLQKTTHLRKIKKSWNNINKLLSLQYSNAKWDVSSFYGDIEFIYNSHNINRIPIQNSLDNLNRDHILRVLHRKFNPKWGLASEQELKLAFSALRDELLLPSHYFEVEEYKNLLQKSQNPLFDDLAYLLQKEYALCNRNLTYSGPSSVHLYKYGRIYMVLTSKKPRNYLTHGNRQMIVPLIR